MSSKLLDRSNSVDQEGGAESVGRCVTSPGPRSRSSGTMIRGTVPPSPPYKASSRHSSSGHLRPAIWATHGGSVPLPAQGKVPGHRAESALGRPSVTWSPERS